MTTNTTPRRYTVDVEGEVSSYSSKAAATKAFHAAAVAGRTVHVFTPAGNLCGGYLAEQGPVEVVDGELRRIVEVAAGELTIADRAAARVTCAHCDQVGGAHLLTCDRPRAEVAEAAPRRRRPIAAAAARDEVVATVEAPAPVDELRSVEAIEAEATARSPYLAAKLARAEVAEANEQAARERAAELETVAAAQAAAASYETDRARRRSTAPDPAELELEAAARRRQLDAAIVEDMLTGAVEPYVDEAPARPASAPRRPRRAAVVLPARQLAIMPLSADEDGAQLDLFEAVAELELEAHDVVRGWCRAHERPTHVCGVDPELDRPLPRQPRAPRSIVASRRVVITGGAA